MKVIYEKTQNEEEVILYKTTSGDLDVRFVRKDPNGLETFNNRVELSVYNHNAQEQLKELFDLYRFSSDLYFQLEDVIKDVPNLARRF